ncbi:hypothetical protein BGX34_002610 [Mortierella sp. NVP85]|nr:hypothetical protein BGX34_002610 [Mortierella sp. NVP85]
MSKTTPQRSSRSIGSKKPPFSALLVLVAMLFSVMVPTVSAKSKLMSGEQLKNGEYLDSPDGNKRFVIQDGKAIIQVKGKGNFQTWLLTPENDQGSDPRQYRFQLDKFGMLAGVDTKDQVTRWIRDGRDLEKARVGAWELSLRNNGLLYLKDPAGVITWNNICDSFQTYLEANTVFVGKCLVSPDYGSFLNMKNDGDLVLYKGYTPVYHFWGLYHGNIRQPSTFIVLGLSGGVYVNSYSKHEQHVIREFSPPLKHDKYRLTITNDAKMRIVDSRGRQMALFRPKHTVDRWLRETQCLYNLIQVAPLQLVSKAPLSQLSSEIVLQDLD